MTTAKAPQLLGRVHTREAIESLALPAPLLNRLGAFVYDLFFFSVASWVLTSLALLGINGMRILIGMEAVQFWRGPSPENELLHALIPVVVIVLWLWARLATETQGSLTMGKSLFNVQPVYLAGDNGGFFDQSTSGSVPGAGRVLLRSAWLVVPLIIGVYQLAIGFRESAWSYEYPFGSFEFLLLLTGIFSRRGRTILDAWAGADFLSVKKLKNQ